MELEMCEWERSTVHSRTIVDPTPAEVRGAVTSLNGDDRNDLYLRSETGKWIGVGGGPDRFFVGFSQSEDGPHFQAYSDAGDDEVSIVLGGQRTTFALGQLVSEAAAIEAAVHFLTTGERSPALSWHER